MIQTQHTRSIGAPTLRGWLSGRPDRESNPALSLAQRLGIRTEPGLYETLAQQWYRAAKWLRTGRAELGSLPWETVPCGSSADDPEGDESFAERQWNLRAVDLVRSRVGVETAIPGQVRYGWSEWVGLVHDAYWFGFTLAAPYWPRGEATLTGEVVMEVMLRSAVDRFRLGPDLRPDEVWYSTATGFQRVSYDRLLHIVPQGVTGQLFGEAALRPLIGPGLAWIQSLVQSGIAEIAESGMLVITGRDGAGDEDEARYEAALRANDDGQLRGMLLYGDESATRQFPSSSSSGRSDRMRHLDEICDAYFSRANASLYSSGAGSRAASETVGDEDSEVREVTADGLVDLAWRTLAGWLASETGYTGRIRGARTVQPEARQSPVELVGALSTAATSGLLRWSEGDEAQLRQALGWRLVEDDEDARAVGAPASSLDDVLSLDSLSMADPHPAGCGCGRVELADRVEILGRDGRPYRTWCAIEPVVIDGVEHRVEESIAWLSEDEADRRGIEDLASLLWPEVEDHRAAVRSALARGATSAELTQIQQQATERYARAIRDAVRRERARQAAESEAVARAQTERAPDRVYTLPVTPATRAVEALLQRTLVQARQAAVTMAGRVQGEAVRQLGIDTPTRITPTGLAREASGAVRSAGQAQVIESGYQSAPEGMGVIAWIRLGFLDQSICEWCRSQHRRRWVMRTGLAEFIDYVDQHGPPDGDCAGTAERCRCRLAPVYGRVG